MPLGALLSQHRVCGEGAAEAREDEGLGGLVHLGYEVMGVLGTGAAPVERERALAD